ncbi:hypothetical protein QUF74_16795, partial [Candidatus Halobeggiatoa sp. HSG11]|nr:hypothetical protein [Candidatus Halobeggiatoa sp. HSG11]
PHWNRAISYLKIGLRYVAAAPAKGYKFIKKVTLSSMPDPEPISYKYGKITNLLIIGQLKTHTEFFMLRYTYGYLSFVRLSAPSPVYSPPPLVDNFGNYAGQPGHIPVHRGGGWQLVEQGQH